jgi:cytochrome c biogenesis protein CcmG/thiol:disulfide interchange protein DsbE
MSEDMSRPRRRSWLAYLPLLIFLALAALFYTQMKPGGSSRLPSPLIGKPIPAFSLPALEGSNRPGFDDAQLRNGQVTVVNVFASWCAPCRDEHPVLIDLSKHDVVTKMGVRLAGLAYKDEPSQSLRFLRELGNPYQLIGVDRSGRVGIDWGVYGVPETFIVKGDGTLAFKFIGPLSPKELLETLIPQIEKAAR